MGLELWIFGVRKLKKEEIRELTGKTRAEIEESECFLKYYPEVFTDARYRCFGQREFLAENDIHEIKHMVSPLKDADGDILYVCWEEELAYYWHKNPDHREIIEQLLLDVGDDMDWEQSYHAVPYELIEEYLFEDPVSFDEEEEVIAFLYG